MQPPSYLMIVYDDGTIDSVYCETRQEALDRQQGIVADAAYARLLDQEPDGIAEAYILSERQWRELGGGDY